MSNEHNEANEVVNQITAEYLKGLKDRYNLFSTAIRLYEETEGFDREYVNYINCKKQLIELKKEIDKYDGK
jgi:hypothetical protein